MLCVVKYTVSVWFVLCGCGSLTQVCCWIHVCIFVCSVVLYLSVQCWSVCVCLGGVTFRSTLVSKSQCASPPQLNFLHTEMFQL